MIAGVDASTMNLATGRRWNVWSINAGITTSALMCTMKDLQQKGSPASGIFVSIFKPHMEHQPDPTSAYISSDI